MVKRSLKYLLTSVTIVLSTSALACFSPIGGSEYDEQIEIVRLGESNRFQVSVPRYMDNMPRQAEIILAYSTGSPGGIPIYDEYEMLTAKVQDKNLIAEFVVNPKRDGKPYIVVMWWPEHAGMCGIQANSDFIET